MASTKPLSMLTIEELPKPNMVTPMLTKVKFVSCTIRRPPTIRRPASIEPQNPIVDLGRDLAQIGSARACPDPCPFGNWQIQADGVADVGVHAPQGLGEQ